MISKIMYSFLHPELWAVVEPLVEFLDHGKKFEPFKCQPSFFMQASCSHYVFGHFVNIIADLRTLVSQAYD